MHVLKHPIGTVFPISISPLSVCNLHRSIALAFWFVISGHVTPSITIQIWTRDREREGGNAESDDDDDGVGDVRLERV